MGPQAVNRIKLAHSQSTNTGTKSDLRHTESDKIDTQGHSGADNTHTWPEHQHGSIRDAQVHTKARETQKIHTQGHSGADNTHTQVHGQTTTHRHTVRSGAGSTRKWLGCRQI